MSLKSDVHIKYESLVTDKNEKEEEEEEDQLCLNQNEINNIKLENENSVLSTRENMFTLIDEMEAISN